MASNSCREKARAALKCKFPPCPCEKCQFDRDTGKPESNEADGNETNEKNGEINFIGFITETIGCVAFFIIATLMFWLAVSQYLLYFGCKIYNSGRYKYFWGLCKETLSRLRRMFRRVKAYVSLKSMATVTIVLQHVDQIINTQIIAMIVLGLLVVSITGEFIVQKIKTKCVATKSSPCPLEAKAKAAAEANKKEVQKLLPPSQIPACTKEDAGIVPKNVTITITDSEAKEIFRQSRMYAIPIEMKQPPALLVYLRDVILTNF